MNRTRNPFSVLLGKKLQKLRREAGYSQEAFAYEVGIHRTYMGLIERGERNMTILTYIRVIRKLGIAEDELLKELPTPGARGEE